MNLPIESYSHRLSTTNTFKSCGREQVIYAYMPKIRLYTVHDFLKPVLSSHDQFFSSYIHRSSISSLVLIETRPLLWGRKQNKTEQKNTEFTPKTLRPLRFPDRSSYLF